LDKYCPTTTNWSKSKVSKEVYLLKESDASIVDYITPEKKGVWNDYFKKNKKN
jgi:hypothetical protein